MEVDDDVEIKQEPTAEEENDYKEAVDQGQQEAEAAGSWSFDESEVDYGDEEDEQDVEMDKIIKKKTKRRMNTTTRIQKCAKRRRRRRRRRSKRTPTLWPNFLNGLTHWQLDPSQCLPRASSMSTQTKVPQGSTTTMS